jgi:uroporphyrinogen decarboxylase
MLSRRLFLFSSVAAVATAGAALTHKQRVDRAWSGKSVDRPPFSYWHHFGLEKQGPEKHAEATIAFHKQFKTDLVKVMSDFPYPKPAGAWYQLKEEQNPFPSQIRALELIRDGVGADAYFLETIFNPWKVAENLSSTAEVLKLKQEKPQALLDALDIIARSEANHARKAIATGASGIFLAIANAQPDQLSREDYAKFSEPFDRQVLEAVKNAPLNTLHLHGDKVYLDHFAKPWPASAINYSVHGTGVEFSDFRKKYRGVLMGGLDEVNYRTLTEDQLRQEWQKAQQGAGARFVLAPGCSVPNDSTDSELARLVNVLNA